MLDRQKIETILTRRFPTATAAQIAAAANGIIGLGDEWEEIRDHDDPWGPYHLTRECENHCRLVHELEQGGELRVFRRRIVG